jgi:hypothetical protein
MSHDAILKHRQNPPAECRIPLAGTGLPIGRSSRRLDPTVWLVAPTGVPISSGSAGNRCARLGRFTRYSDHHQNTCGCCEATSVTCANQRHVYWRDCGTGHRQFSRQVAPPWLIAIGEVYVVSWNLLLIVCTPLNWSRSLPSWFRTGNAALMNPQD